jgi:hypothetical protein
MIWLMFETKFGDRLCALIERKLNRALVTTKTWPGIGWIRLSEIHQ